jgi:hypothetical protein
MAPVLFRTASRSALESFISFSVIVERLALLNFVTMVTSGSMLLYNSSASLFVSSIGDDALR